MSTDEDGNEGKIEVKKRKNRVSAHCLLGGDPDEGFRMMSVSLFR